jgi:hypothetical protein
VLGDTSYGTKTTLHHHPSEYKYKRLQLKFGSDEITVHGDYGNYYFVNTGKDGFKQWMFVEKSKAHQFVTQTIERTENRRMRTAGQQLINSTRYNLEAWNALTVQPNDPSNPTDVERARQATENARIRFFENLLSDVQTNILGTNMTGTISITDRNVNGSYSLNTQNISIGRNNFTYDRVTTVLHENRHRYQHEVTMDVTRHEFISYQTFIHWVDNMKPGNYKQSGAAYYQQPIEWDAFTFAGQLDRLVGYTSPVYTGNW